MQKEMALVFWLLFKKRPKSNLFVTPMCPSCRNKKMKAYLYLYALFIIGLNSIVIYALVIGQGSVHDTLWAIFFMIIFDIFAALIFLGHYKMYKIGIYLLSLEGKSGVGN